MENIPIPFTGETYQSRSPQINSQRCVNMYIDPDYQGQPALVGTPGLTLMHDIGNIRGIDSYKDIGYCVAGNKLYSFNDSTLTEIGTLLTNTGSVGIAHSTIQLIIVDGDNGYIYTFADQSFERITDEDFLGSKTVRFFDGYFTFIQPESQIFYISGLYDGINYDGLDFKSAESQPDDLVAQIADHRELWMLGKESIDVFFNSGNADFPIDRNQVIEKGCAGANAVAKADNSVFWLGNDGIAYRAQGYRPERISNHGIEYRLSLIKNEWESAQAFSYTEEGHVFYVLRLDSSCFVFDVATNRWHERESRIDSKFGNSWRVYHHTYLNNKHVVGGDKLYILDVDSYTENGELIERLRTAPELHLNRNRVFVHKVEIDVESGLGLVEGQQGEDPIIMFDWSDDKGKTFSNELRSSAGQIGEYFKRVVFWRLGHTRGRINRIRMTDPVRWVVTGAYAQFTQGNG